MSTPTTTRGQGAIPGWTWKLKYPKDGQFETIFVTVNGMLGRPVELFIVAKHDQDKLDAIAWAISKLLQGGHDVDDLIRHLWDFRGEGGTPPHPEAHRSIRSVANVCALALQGYLERARRQRAPGLAEPVRSDQVTSRTLAEQGEEDESGLEKISRARAEKAASGYGLCPKCGEQTLKHESGCDLCAGCGYSKCG